MNEDDTDTIEVQTASGRTKVQLLPLAFEKDSLTTVVKFIYGPCDVSTGTALCTPDFADVTIVCGDMRFFCDSGRFSQQPSFGKLCIAAKTGKGPTEMKMDNVRPEDVHAFLRGLYSLPYSELECEWIDIASMISVAYWVNREYYNHLVERVHTVFPENDSEAYPVALAMYSTLVSTQLWDRTRRLYRLILPHLQRNFPNDDLMSKLLLPDFDHFLVQISKQGLTPRTTPLRWKRFCISEDDLAVMGPCNAKIISSTSETSLDPTTTSDPSNASTKISSSSSSELHSPSLHFSFDCHYEVCFRHIGERWNKSEPEWPIGDPFGARLAITDDYIDFWLDFAYNEYEVLQAVEAGHVNYLAFLASFYYYLANVRKAKPILQKLEILMPSAPLTHVELVFILADQFRNATLPDQTRAAWKRVISLALEIFASRGYHTLDTNTRRYFTREDLMELTKLITKSGSIKKR